MRTGEVKLTSISGKEQVLTVKAREEALWSLFVGKPFIFLDGERQVMELVEKAEWL